MPRADKADRKNYNREYYAKRKALLEKAKEIENIQSGETQENIVMNIAEIYAPQQEETIEENPVFITRHDEVAKLKDEISVLNATINELKNKLKDNDELVIEQEELIQDQEYEITEIKIKLKYKDDVIVEKDKQIDFLKELIKNMSANVATNVSTKQQANEPTKYAPNFDKDNYLNEVCKYAINFEDFINDYFNIEIGAHYDNFLNTKFDENISKIMTLFMRYFSEDKTKYPIQVTDKKRGQFYYKTGNKWIYSKYDYDTFDKLLDLFIMKIIKVYEDYYYGNILKKYKDGKLNEEAYEKWFMIKDIKLGVYNGNDKLTIRNKIKTSILELFLVDKKYHSND